MTRYNNQRGRRRGGAAWQWIIIGLVLGFGFAAALVLAGLTFGFVALDFEGAAVAARPSQTAVIVTATRDPDATVAPTQTPWIITNTPDASISSITTLDTSAVIFPTDTLEPTDTLAPLTEPTAAGVGAQPTADPFASVTLESVAAPGIASELLAIASQLVPVEGGVFQMGTIPTEIAEAVRQCIDQGGACQTSYGDDSIPAHAVTINSFLIERTEVTYGQYAAFLNTLRPQGRDHTNGCGTSVPQPCVSTQREDDRSYILVDPASYDITLDFVRNTPVVFVTWYGADAYCRAIGRRLPTEAEWERAARGVSNFLYPWGNDFLGTNANTGGVEGSPTAPVDVESYPSGISGFGVLNMAGNVSEWVNDWYSPTYYAQPGSGDNPQGPLSGVERVTRGGSWADRPFFARSVHRINQSPDKREPTLGFRCASDATSGGLDALNPLITGTTIETGGVTSPGTVPTFQVVGTLDPAALGAIGTPAGGAQPALPTQQP